MIWKSVAISHVTWLGSIARKCKRGKEKEKPSVPNHPPSVHRHLPRSPGKRDSLKEEGIVISFSRSRQEV